MLKSFVLAVLAIVIGTTAFAQKESEIVAKLHKALGRGAIDEPEPPIIMKGKITMANTTMDGVIYYSKPNNRMEMSTGNMKFIVLENDTISWTFNSFSNSHNIKKLSFEERKAERDRELKFDFASKDLLYYKKRKFKLNSLGVQKVDSVETYALRLTKGENDFVDFYINTKTDLVYKISSNADYRVYSNYHYYDGYTYPLFMTTTIKGDRMTMITTDLVVHATIAPSLFQVPKEAYDYVNENEARLERMIKEADSVADSRDYDGAIVQYSSILKEFGGVYRAYNGRGLCRLGQEKYYEAISDFNLALEMVPNGTRALNNRGLAKFYLGDNTGALSDYAASIAADSLNVTPLRNRAIIYMNQKNFNEAVKDYTRVIQLDPTDARSHYRYGISLAQLERYKEAIELYRKAIALKETDNGVFNHTGVSWYKLGNYDSAANSFKKAVSNEKENLQYVDNYGNTLYKLGKYKEAQEQFEYYVSKKDDNADIHNMIGLCKYKEEDYKGAILKFSKSIELAPKNAQYLDNRAAAKEHVHDFEGALADYSASISIYPNDAEVYFKRGMVKIYTSKKLEGCMDLGTANEMKYEAAKEAIRKNCN